MREIVLEASVGMYICIFFLAFVFAFRLCLKAKKGDIPSLAEKEIRLFFLGFILTQEVSGWYVFSPAVITGQLLLFALAAYVLPDMFVRQMIRRRLTTTD